MQNEILNKIAEEMKNKMLELNNIYIELLDICKKENKQIIDEDLKGLIETLTYKEKILNNINQNKIILKEIFEKMKLYLGYKKDDYVPFIRLINFLENKDDLKNIKDKMDEYLANIKNISIINRKLVNDSINFINYIINFLKESDGEIEIYNKNAEKKKNHNELNFLDVVL